jgi:hypothetical protein
VPADPIFYLAAFLSVLLLGLGKGGFSGVGLAATPLLALVVPPLQAAAIILPVLLLQDVISVWAYRRDWDAWNLKVLLPGSVLGVAAGWAFAASVSDAQLRLALGLISLVFVLNVWFGGAKPAYRPGWFSGVFVLGRGLRLHQHDLACGRPAILHARAAAATRPHHLRGDVGDILRDRQRDEAWAVFCARPVQQRKSPHLHGAGAARHSDEFSRHLARARHAE